jgi:outer membrane protein assembly factor BamB
VGEEIILWLKEDLKKVGPKTPVFVFLHHPLGGSEFASRYDYDRLLDVLREYNTVLLMAGHSHGYVHRAIHGLDQMTGGSTFGPNSGLAVVSVKDRTLRAAYWKNDQPAPHHKLIEKPIPAETSHPKVEISAPAFRSVAGSTLTLAAQLTGAVEVDKATWTINDDLKGELALTGGGAKWQATGSAQIGGLLPGAHYLRVEFSKGDQRYARSTQFFFEPTSRPTAWRAYLAASSKVTPTLTDGVVYVGANDGQIRAFNAQSGKALWSANTGAEILAQPLVDGDRVYSANGQGEVSAFTKTGKKLWSFTAGDAVYSSPVMAGSRIIFGCNDGKLHAVDAASGQPAWVNSDAAYAIESKPFVANGKVYYGAWDQQIRCVDANDGKLLWKQICEGARVATAAHRYYSPGDAMPVVAEGKLHIADRNYRLTILDADTGELLGAGEKVSATGLSENGRFVYLRKTDGQLAKTDSSGKELWSVPAEMNAIPTAPTEKNGVVYVASAKGMVSALAADDGKLLWRYQASPQLFVMSSVVSDGTHAYVTAFDGTLTAIKCP